MSRVLVYEHDPELTALFKLLLEADGHTPVVAKSLGEVAAAAENGIDLILTQAPDTFTRSQSPSHWRALLQEAAPGVPAVLCSAASLLTKTRAIIAGFDGFVEMPFDIADALNEVGRVLGNKTPCRYSEQSACGCR